MRYQGYCALMNTVMDFKTILKRELEQRIGRNPRYSMRAFAKDLNLAPALLSDVLNGNRGLSVHSAGKIAKRLGMSASETKIFCDLVESKHARSKLGKQLALQRLEGVTLQGRVLKFLTLDQTKFNILADWYHLAILELLRTLQCEHSAAWIAKRLEISKVQAESALERMQELGLVIVENGRYIPTAENFKTPDGMASNALKLHHEQFLKKANEALFTQSVEERDFRGLTIKCKKSDVNMVRDKLKKFLVELDIVLSADPSANEVYQLSTQFFCLTKPQP